MLLGYMMLQLHGVAVYFGPTPIGGSSSGYLGALIKSKIRAVSLIDLDGVNAVCPV